MTRPRSVKEMRDYLWRKTRPTKRRSPKTGEIIERPGVKPEIAERVLALLIEKKYLDDEKFARFWYSAVSHIDIAICNAMQPGETMLRNHHGIARRFQSGDDVSQVPAAFLIQIGGRFVTDIGARMQGMDSGYCHPLLLTA